MRPHHDDPEIPEGVVARDLPGEARVELKTLSKDNAEWVAQHLVMVSRLIESDPELAHRHALSAARRAGRIGVVRETLAITAYATGDFALALRELRTYRRISGSNDQLPLMVDSERGVGRPDRALELGRSVEKASLPADVQVSLAIAMSGARLDLEQPEAALAELEIPQLDPNRAFSWSPDLFHAYAEVLEELGRDEQAASWRERAEHAAEALAEALDIDEHETIDVIEEEIFLDPGDFSAAAVEAEVDELLADDEDEPAEAAWDGDAEAETVSEAEAEAVVDTESSADAKSSADAESSADAKSSADAESSADAKSSAYAESSADADLSANADLSVEAGEGVKAGADIESDDEIRAEAEFDVDVEADAEVDSKLDTKLDSELEADSAVETETETSVETETDIESDDEIEAGAGFGVDVETETQAESQAVEEKGEPDDGAVPTEH